jgi:hypothetical protein
MRNRLTAVIRQPLILGGLLVVLLCSAGPSSTSATTYVDGISDQHLETWAGTFTELGFTAPITSFFANSWVGSPPSHIKLARYVVQWDVMRGIGYPEEFTHLQNWYNEATALGLTPDLTMANYGCSGCAAPEKPEYYTRELEALHSSFPAISVFEAWNEPNFSGSFHVTATKAAELMNADYAFCAGHGCTAVAGDFLDSESNMVEYETQYKKGLTPKDPGVWGIHPYANTKYEAESHTVEAFRNDLPNPSTDAIWFTEVGAYRCELGTARSTALQEQNARYLTEHLIPAFHPVHVFYYQAVWPEDLHPPCTSTTVDTALYAAEATLGPVLARPAAKAIFGPEGPPSAATDAASGMTETQATITGTVNPNGLALAKYYFQFGPTTAYGGTTAEGSIGPGLNPVGESAILSGLQPGTLYHYRIVATSTAGTTYAPIDGRFRTRGGIQSIYYNGGGSLEESFWNG